MRAGLDYTHIPVNYGTLLHDRYVCFKILYFCHLLDYVEEEPKYSPQEDDPEMYRLAQ